MFKFDKTYFALFAFILNVEILIALYAHDAFIRPYVGDTLSVILLYCFFKSFLNTKILPTAIAVLLIAFAIETLQYFNILDKLEVKSKVLRVVLGMSFEWTDMLTYVAGFIIILVTEKLCRKS